MEEYNKEKVLEIYNNLQNTYNNMSDRHVLVSDNSMFKPARASKAMIKRKMDEIKRKYNL